MDCGANNGRAKDSPGQTHSLCSTALLGCQEDSQPFSHREGGRPRDGEGAVPGRWLCGTAAGQLGLKGGGGGAVRGRPDENETDWYRADLIQVQPQVYWGWGGALRRGDQRSRIFRILMLMRNITITSQMSSLRH